MSGFTHVKKQGGTAHAAVRRSGPGPTQVHSSLGVLDAWGFFMRRKPPMTCWCNFLHRAAKLWKIFYGGNHS